MEGRMGAFVGSVGVGRVVGGGLKVRGVCSRRKGGMVMGIQRDWKVEEDGKVQIPSPFGIVRRELEELPPRMLMAAQMPEVDEERLKVLKGKLADGSSSSSDLLAAISEMRFFPKEMVVGPLLGCLRTTRDELARSQILWTLALFRDGEDDCWNTILTELDDLSSPTVSSAAAGALGTIGDPDGITALVRAFNMADDFIVQMSAVVALGTIGDRSILPQLVSWLSRYDPQKEQADSLIIQSLLGAIGDLGAIEGLDVVLRWADHKEPMVRHQVAQALLNFNVQDPRIEAQLEKFATESEEPLGYSAKEFLALYRSRG